MDSAATSTSSRHDFVLSPFVMSITIVVLLLGCISQVSSSPTPSSSSSISIDLDNNNNNNNKVNYESDGFMFEPSDYRAALTGDSSLPSGTVQHALSDPSSLWYVQPRTRAHQFLVPHLSDNEITSPKWLNKFHHYNQLVDHRLDSDDLDDDAQASLGFNVNKSASLRWKS
jgi:hypothetical protein